MPTNNQQYIEDCQRTLSSEFHGELATSDEVVIVITDLIDAGKKLDLIKKALFYGKSLNSKSASEYSANYLFAHLDKTIVHGIIGKATETIELLEALIEAALNETEIDLVNIKEEVGDGFWYDAILAKACGFTFEEAQQTNIAKLKARYPEKFTSENAEKRDLDKEREILEQTQVCEDCGSAKLKPCGLEGLIQCEDCGGIDEILEK
jgi:NTP pyrophosphatase (non-canonical NTP hydrolase)